MDGTGNLLLEFVTARNEKPNDRVDLQLTHTVLSQHVSQRDFATTKKLRLTGLDSTQGGLYRLQVFPLRHRPVSRFLRITENQTLSLSLTLVVKPERVSEVKFPDFAALGSDLQQALANATVEGLENQAGARLYQALDNVQRAGLLNLYTKMKATKFANGNDVFSFINTLTRIRGDRFFAKIKPELRDAVKNSQANQLFREVSGGLHTPPPHFELVDSFKTLDPFGNLQLTFFNNPEALDFLVDADIDEAQGLEHITQVVEHVTTGAMTNPFDIHEILLVTQGLDPGYEMIV